MLGSYCTAPPSALETLVIVAAYWLARFAWRAITREIIRMATQNHAAPRCSEFLTIPEAADHLGISYTQALRTCERGFYTDAVRIGRQRAIRADQIEEFRKAAREAGYLE